LAREQCATLGNFWVDVTRSLLWVLLPGAIVGSLLLVAQGVPMNFHHYVVASTLEGAHQVIPQGPVAALEIIKNLGTNGGGFSMQTVLIRARIPRRLQTSWSCYRSFCYRRP
jgi:K+-transporting ATPase ATPase A chain